MSTLFRKLDKLLAPIWVLLIFIGSTAPTQDITLDPNVLLPHIDKIVHFVMYFVLLVLFQRHNMKYGNRYSIWLIFLICIGYGFLIECIQGHFLKARFFENYDIIANITGAFVGILFVNRKKS